MKFVYFLVGVSIRKGEDKEESLTRPHVLLPHGTELLLSRGVQNWNKKTVRFLIFKCAVLCYSLTVELGHGVINDTLLRVGILDGGVIVSHEVALENKQR